MPAISFFREALRHRERPSTPRAEDGTTTADTFPPRSRRSSSSRESSSRLSRTVLERRRDVASALTHAVEKEENEDCGEGGWRFKQPKEQERVEEEETPDRKRELLDQKERKRKRERERKKGTKDEKEGGGSEEAGSQPDRRRIKWN